MRLAARSPALPRSTDAPTPWSRPDRSRDQWNGRRHNAPILVERSRSERSSHDKAIWAVILTCALALAACSPPHHDRRQQQHCNETLVEPRNEWIRRRRRRGILTHGLRRHPIVPDLDADFAARPGFLRGATALLARPATTEARTV